MALTLISFPQGDFQSRYFPVNNPIIYTFQSDAKSDGAFNSYSFVAASVGTGPGQTRMTILDERVRRVMNPGDLIRVGDNAIRTVTYVSPDAPPPGLANVRVDAALPFQEGVTITSLNNYRAEFRILHGRKDIDNLGNWVMKQVGVNVSAAPDAQGRIRINLQPYLKPFVNLERTLIDPQRKNTPDKGVWGRFVLQYRERYDGDGVGPEQNWTPETPALNNMRWWVSAVKQIKQEQILVHTAPGFAGPRVKMLSAFNKPEYYIGYPNEISFLWPELENYEFLSIEEKKYNQAKQLQSTAVTDLESDGRQELNRVLLNPVTAPGFYTVQLNDGIDQTVGYVVSGYALITYVERI